VSDSTVRSPEPPGPPCPRTRSALTAQIRAQRRTVLLVNTRSRRGQRLYATARARLESAGFRLLACRPVRKPGELTDALAEAVAMEPDLLVVGGGDGTLSEAAHHLAYRDICLGVLPLGTTNNFARSLGVPLRFPAALEVLARGQVADVDLARVGDRRFANLVSLGVSVQVAARVRPRVKRVLGRLAYPLAAVSAMPGHRPFLARITTGSGPQAHRIELHTHQLNIANGSYHAGRRIARDARIDDRLLVVYRLGADTRRHLVTATVLQMLAGPRRALGSEPFVTTRELLLETEPPQRLDIDGEVIGSTPTRIRLEPEALRVMVPAGFAPR
jgi:diacylglycerol kinase (ATP)